MSTIYRVDVQGSKSTVIDIGHVPGRSRAFGFLSNLFSILQKNSKITKLDKVISAVEFVEKRVQRKWRYNVFSWIPFTEAHSVAQLILSVKNELDQLKAEKIRIYIEEAKNNTTNLFNFFSVSPQLISLIKDVEYLPEKNQGYLYFGLSDSTKGILSNSSTMFYETYYLSMLIEFDETNNFIEVLRLTKSIFSSSENEFDIQNELIEQVFNVLRNYK